MTLSIFIEGIPMTVSVEYDRYIFDRHNYRWTVKVEDKVWTDTDLRSGCSDRDHYPPMADMLDTLLTFLGAAADSIDYGRRTGTAGENADMLPADLGEILGQCGEQLTMAAWELKGSDDDS